jgi:hypothetical protein
MISDSPQLDQSLKLFMSKDLSTNCIPPDSLWIDTGLAVLIHIDNPRRETCLKLFRVFAWDGREYADGWEEAV